MIVSSFISNLGWLRFLRPNAKKPRRKVSKKKAPWNRLRPLKRSKHSRMHKCKRLIANSSNKWQVLVPNRLTKKKTNRCRQRWRRRQRQQQRKHLQKRCSQLPAVELYLLLYIELQFSSHVQTLNSYKCRHTNKHTSPNNKLRLQCRKVFLFSYPKVQPYSSLCSWFMCYFSPIKYCVRP